MSLPAQVTIHPSQFPESVRRDLLESLRARRVNHKFHYDSVKQAQKWLALHEACSPSRHDADCRTTYERAFEAASKKISAPGVNVIGLGCGGGQKDTRLLELLQSAGKDIGYTPCDVSAAMVLAARQTALAVVPEAKCRPLVCDLATADDLPAVLENMAGPARRADADGGARLITFFGMIPNFEPGDILPKLAGLMRATDHLLFSANLAPGADYAAGVKKILPQYDNALTRDWLMAFLLDLGVERTDGEMCFGIEEGPGDLKKIVARYLFRQSRRIEVGRETFEFRAGEDVQLFFSYRYTPALVREVLAAHGLKVEASWITKSEEEGVFLCRAGGTSYTSPKLPNGQGLV